MDRCRMPRCRGLERIHYIDVGLCSDCWAAISSCDAHSSRETELLAAIGLQRGPDGEVTSFRGAGVTHSTGLLAHAGPGFSNPVMEDTNARNLVR